MADGGGSTGVITNARIRVGWWGGRRYMRRMRRHRLDTDDRRTLEERIFPALHRRGDVRRILFVGVNPASSWYAGVFAGRPDTRFETVDADPAAARYGAPGAHRVGRFEELADDPHLQGAYDVVLLNGVFEYGTDGDPAKHHAIRAARALLRPDGLLLVGYRDDPVGPDVRISAILGERFEPTKIPGLHAARHRTKHSNGHAYAAFSRR